MLVTGQTNFSYLPLPPPPPHSKRWSYIQFASGITFIISTVGIALIAIALGHPLVLSYTNLLLFSLPCFVSGGSFILFILSQFSKEYITREIVYIYNKQPETQIEEKSTALDEISFKEETYIRPIENQNLELILKTYIDSLFKDFTVFSKRLISIFDTKRKTEAIDTLFDQLWIFARGLLFNERFILTQLLASIVKPLPHNLVKRQLCQAHNLKDQKAFDYYQERLKIAEQRNDHQNLSQLVGKYKKANEGQDSISLFVLGFLEDLKAKIAIIDPLDDPRIEKIKSDFLNTLIQKFETYPRSKQLDKELSSKIEKIIESLKKDQSQRNHQIALMNAQNNLIDSIVTFAIVQDSTLGGFFNELWGYLCSWMNDPKKLTSYIKSSLDSFIKDFQVNIHLLQKFYFEKGQKEEQLKQIFTHTLSWENIIYENPIDEKNQRLLEAQYAYNQGKKNACALVYVPLNASWEEIAALPVVQAVCQLDAKALEKLNQKVLFKDLVTPTEKVVVIPCKMEKYILYLHKDYEGGALVSFLSGILGAAIKLLTFFSENFNIQLPLELPGLNKQENERWKKLIVELIPYFSRTYFNIMFSGKSKHKEHFLTLLTNCADSFIEGLNSLKKLESIDLSTLQQRLSSILLNLIKN